MAGELSFNRSAFESEFAATPEPRQVRITWNGIASLWAFGYGAARVACAMFEAQRAANPEDPPPELPVGGELLTGTRFLELSVRLTKHRFDHWVDWVPGPDALDETGPGAEGSQLFLGALGWIRRHEFAHHILNHHELRSGMPADSKAQELEADDRATIWMKSGHTAELERQFRVRPSPSEMELERRALVILVGVIRLAQFEVGPHGKNTTHPDAVTKLNAMIQRLALAQDSFATETLSYLVKVLIDPGADWPADSESSHAIDAATDAMIRLNRRRINAG